MIISNDDILILYRKDLYGYCKKVDTENISTVYFPSEFREDIHSKSLVVFVDNDEYKILKYRYNRIDDRELNMFVKKYIGSLKIKRRKKIIDKILGS